MHFKLEIAMLRVFFNQCLYRFVYFSGGPLPPCCSRCFTLDEGASLKQGHGVPSLATHSSFLGIFLMANSLLLSCFSIFVIFFLFSLFGFCDSAPPSCLYYGILVWNFISRTNCLYVVSRCFAGPSSSKLGTSTAAWIQDCAVCCSLTHEPVVDVVVSTTVTCNLLMYGATTRILWLSTGVCGLLQSSTQVRGRRCNENRCITQPI